jgi:hypothetical protein
MKSKCSRNLTILFHIGGFAGKKEQIGQIEPLQQSKILSEGDINTDAKN